MNSLLEFSKFRQLYQKTCNTVKWDFHTDAETDDVASTNVTFADGSILSLTARKARRGRIQFRVSNIRAGDDTAVYSELLAYYTYWYYYRTKQAAHSVDEAFKLLNTLIRLASLPKMECLMEIIDSEEHKMITSKEILDDPFRFANMQRCLTESLGYFFARMVQILAKLAIGE